MPVERTGYLGIGTSSPALPLEVQGGTFLNGEQRIKRTTVADANYTVLTSDYYVGMTSISGARTWTLPLSSAATEQILVFKDESGNAGSTNKITIQVAGGSGDTIEGAGSIDIVTACGSITVFTPGNGTWLTV